MQILLATLLSLLLTAPAAATGGTQSSGALHAGLTYASGLIEDGLYEAALSSLKQVPMDDDKQVGHVFLEMAKLYAALGSTGRALDAVEQARSLLAPATPRLQIEQARLHIAVGNLVHARSLLSSMTSGAGVPVEIKEDLVILRARTQLAVGGVDSALEVLKAGPAGERLTLEQAKILVAQSAPEKARELLQGFVAGAPDSGRSWLKLAEISKTLGLGQEADKAVDQAQRVFRAQQDIVRLNDVKRVASMTVANVTPPVQAKPAKPSPPLPPTPPSPPASTPLPPPMVKPAPPVSPPAATAPSAPAVKPSGVAVSPFPFPPGSRIETGSGFVLDAGRRVITNRHVVEQRVEISVRNSLGNLSRARIESMSSTDDLAVLVLQEPFPAVHAIGFSQFGFARAGASIAVIGFPLIDILGSVTPSITNGIVIKETGMQDAPEMFQVSAKMNRGNSGGAVVDSRGRVVGVAMGKLDTVKIMQGDGFLPEDVNFAIHAKRLMGMGLSIQSDTTNPREMSLEEIYQRFIGSVVMVAAR
jgi:serine protease Do